MSMMVGPQIAPRALERPLMKPLDEAVWQAWVAKVTHASSIGTPRA